MFGMGMQEMIIIGVVAVLLFGKRLPEVARNLGKSYMQFKSQLSEFQFDLNAAVEDEPSRKHATLEDHSEDLGTTSAPKFTPPPAEEG